MRLSLLIHASLFVGAFSLKGGNPQRSSHHSAMKQRHLKEPKESKESTEAAKKAGKDAKSAKDSKSDKSAKESKSCKKAKADKKEPKQKSSRFLQGTTTAAEETPVPEASEPEEQEERYCLHGEKTAAVCAAMKEGKKPPKEAKEKSVSGGVGIDISHDNENSDEMLEEVDGILKQKTPPGFLGCEMQRLLVRALNEDDIFNHEGESDERQLSVTGVDFDELALAEAGCAVEPSKSSKFCEQVATSVQIYFDGKDEPTAEETQDMFDLLVATIESQADAGDFASVGTVEGVRAGNGSGNKTGRTIGISVSGVLVVAAAVVGSLFYKRHLDVQAAGEKGHDTASDSEDDIPVAEARVLSVEGDGKDAYGKKDQK